MYLGQLLYFIFGKLWEIDSFVCFTEWCWAGHQKGQSSLRWEATSFLLQSIFSVFCLWWLILSGKTKVTAQLQVVCNPSCSRQPDGLSIKEGRQGGRGHGFVLTREADDPRTGQM